VDSYKEEGFTGLTDKRGGFMGKGLHPNFENQIEKLKEEITDAQTQFRRTSRKEVVPV
jgi:hypothetical protein